MLRRYLSLPLVALFSGLVATTASAQIGQFTLTDWPATDSSLKPMYVGAMMEQAEVNRVGFANDAAFYVSELNRFASFAQSHNLIRQLKSPVTMVLASIAVVHCDWNNGAEPREFAYTYMGKDTLALYGQLYPEQVARLQRNCAP